MIRTFCEDSFLDQNEKVNNFNDGNVMKRDKAIEIGSKMMVNLADEGLIQNRFIDSSAASSNSSSYDSSDFDSFESESQSQTLEMSNDSSENSFFTNETSETFNYGDSSDGSIGSIDGEMIGGVDFFKSQSSQNDNVIGAQTMNILGITAQVLSDNTVHASRKKNEQLVETNTFNKKNNTKLNGEIDTLFYTKLSCYRLFTSTTLLVNSQ